MEKVTSFDRKSIQAIRVELDAVIKKVAEKYGIEMKAKNASYGKATATIRVELSVVGEDGEVASREAEAFKHYAVIIGMKAEDLNKEFALSNGVRYKLLGYYPRKSKFPMLARNLTDGKEYCLPELSVKKSLGYAS